MFRFGSIHVYFWFSSCSVLVQSIFIFSSVHVPFWFNLYLFLVQFMFHFGSIHVYFWFSSCSVLVQFIFSFCHLFNSKYMVFLYSFNSFCEKVWPFVRNLVSLHLQTYFLSSFWRYRISRTCSSVG